MSKAKKNLNKFSPSAILHVNATSNNTKVCISRPNGDVLKNISAGMLKLSGRRKSTTLAGSDLAKVAFDECRSFGITKIERVLVSGPGFAKSTFLDTFAKLLRDLSNSSSNDSDDRKRSGKFASSSMVIERFDDVTPVPHNGPRPKKKKSI